MINTSVIETLNVPALEISKVPMMNQFDMAYSMGGFYWMVLYYPVIFLNFIAMIRVIEYCHENNWPPDMIAVIFTVMLFIVPMAIFFTVWYLHNKMSVI